jgi:hypothetical protein
MDVTSPAVSVQHSVLRFLERTWLLLFPGHSAERKSTGAEMQPRHCKVNTACQKNPLSVRHTCVNNFTKRKSCVKYVRIRGVC